MRQCRTVGRRVPQPSLGFRAIVGRLESAKAEAGSHFLLRRFPVGIAGGVITTGCAAAARAIRVPVIAGTLTALPTVSTGA